MPGPDSKDSQAPHNPLKAEPDGENLPELSSWSLALRSDAPVLARLGKRIASEVFQHTSLSIALDPVAAARQRVKDYLAKQQESRRIEALSGDLQAELLLAAIEGRADAVKRLLAAGVEADVEDSYGNGVTPLWWASTKGHADVVKLLLAAGANVEAAADKSLSMLYWACFGGHAEVVKLLLAAGANVNARGTPLISACWFGDAEVVKLLLAAGADVNTVSTLDGTTPLSSASQKAHADVIKLLKAAGAKK